MHSYYKNKAGKRIRLPPGNCLCDCCGECFIFCNACKLRATERKDELERIVRGLVKDWCFEEYLLQYLERLFYEFDDITQLSHAVVRKVGSENNIVKCVDPTLFEVLGVKTLGNKLMLAKVLLNAVDEGSRLKACASTRKTDSKMNAPKLK